MKSGLTGRLMQDDSSHWYFVPDERCSSFEADLSHLDDDAERCADFDDDYGQYRLEMHPSQYKFIMVGEVEP